MKAIKKGIRLFVVLMFTVISAACGTKSGDADSGWHFQGRDCLSCHNVDLAADRHLTIGGTVFLSPDAGDIDDLSNVCNGSLRIQLLDTDSNVIYDSINYDDPGSKGYKGKGNIFILKRKLASLQGYYYINIVSADGTTIAQSGMHTFTSSFDKTNPADMSNRYSCNACHSTTPVNGAPGLIYAAVYTDKCK